MALIKCTECGKEISDSAMACPHCGCKTLQAEKAEAAKAMARISGTVNLVCIALDVIGAILFFPGIMKLHDYGYNLFFGNWADSYRDVVVEAGRRSVTGLVLMTVGFVGAILYKRFVDRIIVNSMSGAAFSSDNEKLKKAFKNASSAPSSTKKTCPHCGNVVKSNVCDMCGKDVS